MFFLRGISLLLLIALCYGLPLASWASFICITIVLYASILKKINNQKSLWGISIIIILSLCISRYYIINDKIEIGEQIYSAEDKVFNELLPKSISEQAKKELKALKLPFPVPISYNQNKENNWAFSADSFFKKPQMTRYANYLDFENRHEFRIGVLNDAKYNYFAQNLGSSGAYYPLIFHFLIPNSLSNETFCWRGKIFLKFNDKWEYKNSIKKQCLHLKNYFESENKILKIYAFDFDQQNQLSISLISTKNILINLLTILSSVIVLLLLTRLEKKDFILIAFASFGIVIFLIDQHYRGGHPSAFSGFPYMGRGNDGLTHYSFAREMTEALSRGDFIEWLRGKENIFYYMPGMRYIWGISMPFFGESFFGLLALISLVPLAIKKILSGITNKKFKNFLLFCFLILPIFEAFGFFHIYLIKYTIEGFGAGFAIACLISAISLIWQKDLKLIRKSELYFAGILLFIAMALRPNYGPAIFVILLGLTFYYLFIYQKISYLFLLALGFSPFLLIPIHNYYFGNKFIPITNSANIQNNMRNSPDIWLECLTSNQSTCYDIISHLQIWISYKEPWYVVIFLLLWFIVFNSKTIFFERILAISMLAGHLVFLFYEGVARYSHGIWIISFLVCIPYIQKNIWPKIIKNSKIIFNRS